MAAGINDTFRQVGIAMGIAVWGAIFVGRGADKVAELTAGTPAGAGDRPRELVEAASSGGLDHVLASVRPGARPALADAASAGFLAGFNDVLTLGGIVCLAGAGFALWLVRESDIDRAPEAAGLPDPAGARV